jgi:hypothetical protein
VRIAKPLLLTITPLGVAGGLYEARRFGSGVLLLMVALLTFIGAATFFVVRVIRREQAQMTDNHNEKF